MQASKKNNILVWNLVVFFVAVCLIGGILIYTGTLRSGYHFLDDHEIVRLSYRMQYKNKTWLELLMKQLQSDLQWRYRPVYWMERVGMAALFGSNMYLWNLYTCLKGIATFLFLSLFVRYLKFDKWMQLLFPAFVMVGPQFMPWYRSANQENTGLLLLSLALCLLAAQSFYEKEKSKVFDITMAVCAILCGMVKESFTLFLPVLLWMRFCLEANKYKEQKKYGQILRHGIFFYIPVSVSMMINVAMILFYVKTDQVSYAGFGRDTGIQVYLEGIRKSLFINTAQATYFAVFSCILGAVFLWKLSGTQKRKLLLYMSVPVAACLLQLAAHAKSTMSGRYIIPYIISLGMAFVLLTYRLAEKNRVAKGLFLVALLAVVGNGCITAVRMAGEYATDGRAICEYFDTILRNTEETDLVLCAFSDRELNIATESYLQTNGRTVTASYLPEGECKSLVRVEGKKPKKPSYQKAKVVVGYCGQEKDILYNMGINDPDKAEIVNCYRYCIIIRKL